MRGYVQGLAVVAPFVLRCTWAERTSLLLSLVSAMGLTVADEVLADGTALRVEKHLHPGVCRSHLHRHVRACPRLLLPATLGPETGPWIPAHPQRSEGKTKVIVLCLWSCDCLLHGRG